MGADGFYGWGRSYSKANIPHKKEIIRYFVKQHVYGEVNCVKDTIVKGIYYGIYEIPKNKSWTAHYNKTTAIVVIPRVRGDELILRFETEGVGPYYTDMPVSYLKLLGPTDDPYAMEWRGKVFTNSKKSKRY